MRACVVGLVLWGAIFSVGICAGIAAEGGAAAPINRLTADELGKGWILLFDGETTYGWEPGSKAHWEIQEGVLSVSSGAPGLLCTTSEFADFELRVDFRAAEGTNSGVFLRTPVKPRNPAEDCYELNIAAPAVSPFPTGSYVQRKRSLTGKFDEEWHTFHVSLEGGKSRVKLDGETVLDYEDPRPLKRGRIGLQFNVGKVEFRNVKLRPLGLERLTNGKDLTGWSVFPGKQSTFSVNTEGEVSVKSGPGALVSDRLFGDFVAQWEVFSNGRHLNSGVFFRGIPGEYTQGYECQIQNGYKEGDRSKPIDCGTGGFYRRQNARRVNADDFAWTNMTLVVSGKHMAAWVNGLQVSDWTDPRPADANPRKGCRTEAGTLALQGHDPTTDLRFRGISAVELPASDSAAADSPASGAPAAGR